MRRIYVLATAALFALTACDNVTEPDPASPRIDRLINSGPGESAPALGADKLSPDGLSKIILCHRRGNGAWNLVEVAEAAVDAHRDHGDTEPPCAPTPLEPIDGQLIPQNNPATQCPAHPYRGQGMRFLFDWTDSLSPVEIAGYELYAHHVGATYPIESRFVTESEFEKISCSFVIDRNLLDWEWKVRARDIYGRYGPWSEIGEFGFEPCRLANGQACSAPQL